MNITHTFYIKATKATENWIISVPAMELEGDGYPDYNRSVEFARDMISEYLMDLSLSEVIRVRDENNQIAKDNSEYLPIEIELDAYKDECKVKEARDYLLIDSEEKNAKPFADNVSEYKNKAQKYLKTSLDKIPFKKRVLAAIVAVVICVSGVTIGKSIENGKQKRYIEETIQTSREYIQKGQFEEGYKEIEGLEGAKGATDYIEEIKSLYNYSYVSNERQKSSPISIEKQYDYSRQIAFKNDDQFYSDAEMLKADIKKEYDADQIQKHVAAQKAAEEKKEKERLAALEEEKQEAKQMREYYEKLVTTIPFKGMEAKYIDCTMCGAHDYEETSLGGVRDYDLCCYWQTDKANWFRVYIKDDEVIDVEQLHFISDSINDDGLPNIDLLRTMKKPKIDDYDSERDSEVDDYWTGKEYADSKYSEYKNEIIQSEQYKGAEEKDINNIAWMRAFNHWLENHEPRFYDARGL